MIEEEGGVVEDVSVDAAGGTAVADLESAGGDGGEAGVSVFTGEGQNSGAELGYSAVAGDDTADVEVVAAIEDEGGIVDDTAGDTAAAAVADLKSAGGDGGSAGVGVGNRPRIESSGMILVMVPLRDDAGVCDGVAAVEDEGGVVEDVASDTAGGAPLPIWSVPLEMVVRPV